MLEEKKAANTIDGSNIGSVDLARMLEMCIGEGHCGYQGEGVCPLRNNINCLFELARMAAARICELDDAVRKMRMAMTLTGVGSDLCVLCIHALDAKESCSMTCDVCRADCGCRDCSMYSNFRIQEAKIK